MGGGATEVAKAEFAEAFKNALEQGVIRFGITNFQGWGPECPCEDCRIQRVIFDYLFPADSGTQTSKSHE